MTKQKGKFIRYFSAGILLIGLTFVFSGCSLVETEKVERLSDSEAAIQKLFMAKYPEIKSPGVWIFKEDNTHIKGSISLCPGDPCRGGTFLAVKLNDSWQLIFDGVENGGSRYSCDLAVANGFSPEMIADCFNTACSKETKKCPDGTVMERQGLNCEFSACH